MLSEDSKSSAVVVCRVELPAAASGRQRGVRRRSANRRNSFANVLLRITGMLHASSARKLTARVKRFGESVAD